MNRCCAPFRTRLQMAMLLQAMRLPDKVMESTQRETGCPGASDHGTPTTSTAWTRSISKVSARMHAFDRRRQCDGMLIILLFIAPVLGRKEWASCGSCACANQRRLGRENNLRGRLQ